jgi:hypothetical protein
MIKLLFLFLVLVTSGFKKDNLCDVLTREKNFNKLWNRYGYGSMGNYKTPKELSRLCNQMVEEFPELVTEIDIGRSF